MSGEEELAAIRSFSSTRLSSSSSVQTEMSESEREIWSGRGAADIERAKRDENEIDEFQTLTLYIEPWKLAELALGLFWTRAL